MKLDGPGFHEITGLAWSGRGSDPPRRRLDRRRAHAGARRRCRHPVLPICHTRFRFPWTWDGKEAILQSRCVDETGYVQPTLGQLIAVRGLNGPLGSIYHLNGDPELAGRDRRKGDQCPLTTEVALALAHRAAARATARAPTQPATDATASARRRPRPSSARFVSAAARRPRIAARARARSREGKAIYAAAMRIAATAPNLAGRPRRPAGRRPRARSSDNAPAKAPVKTVESYWPYATTLFDYIKRAMPLTAPGQPQRRRGVRGHAPTSCRTRTSFPTTPMLDAERSPKVRCRTATASFPTRAPRNSRRPSPSRRTWGRRWGSDDPWHSPRCAPGSGATGVASLREATSWPGAVNASARPALENCVTSRPSVAGNRRRGCRQAALCRFACLSGARASVASRVRSPDNPLVWRI